MLALEFTFLSGRYFGAAWGDRNSPDYPPHPGRAFSALVAAAYEAALGEPALAVLRWLEQQEPPGLYASDYDSGTTPTVFVPTNEATLKDKKQTLSTEAAKQGGALPERRNRQPRRFPAVTPHDPRVVYCWLEATPDDSQLEHLDRITRYVTHLGTSRSPVSVRRIEDVPPLNLMPATMGELALMVPYPGRLADLDQAFALGQRPAAGRWQRYVPVTVEAPAVALPCGTHDWGPVFALDQPVPVVSTLALTQRLRAQVLRQGEHLPGVLSGHSPQQEHVMWVTLPYVGHDYADGGVRGVVLLLPRDLPPGQQAQVLRWLAVLEQVTLPGVGVRRLLPLTSARPLVTLRRATWQGPAAEWTTVTPVILDRLPRRQRTAETIIAQSLMTAGYPEPVLVETHRTPMLRGVEPSWHFPVQRKPQQPVAPYTHVTVRFAQPVQGPLLVGRGRYFGLGLFYPLRESPAKATGPVGSRSA